jgi:hypothetical protein
MKEQAMLDNSLSRRQLMRFGGAGLGAAVLTACGTNKTPVVVDPSNHVPKPKLAVEATNCYVFSPVQAS